jgi:hypothetical protein
MYANLSFLKKNQQNPAEFPEKRCEKSFLPIQDISPIFIGLKKDNSSKMPFDF